MLGSYGVRERYIADTTCLLGPTTTCMLRNLQRQFPIGTQPIVKTGRLRRLQFLDDTDVVGSPPRKLAPNC